MKMDSVRVTLKKSLIGATRRQKEAARCLGLRKIGVRRVFKNSPAMLGQTKMIRHLISLENVDPEKSASALQKNKIV